MNPQDMLSPRLVELDVIRPSFLVGPCVVCGQERLEGSFRFLHASFRSHIEAIAFCRGVGVEQQRVDGRFDRVVANRRAIIRRHLPLYLFTYFFDYIGSIVNYAGTHGTRHCHTTPCRSSAAAREGRELTHGMLCLSSPFACLSASAVGASILWLTYSNQASSSEIAGLVAQGSFSCLYLINGFSTILDTYEVRWILSGDNHSTILPSSHGLLK